MNTLKSILNTNVVKGLLSPNTAGMPHPKVFPRSRILYDIFKRKVDRVFGVKPDYSKLPDFLRPENK